MADRLLPFPVNNGVPDTSLVDGTYQVEQRFLDLTHSYLRIKGEELPIPPEIDADMFRWRELSVRLRGGDFRYRPSEVKALKNIAQWTLVENAKLRNQPPPEVRL